MRAAQAFAKLWHLQLYADSQLVLATEESGRRREGGCLVTATTSTIHLCFAHVWQSQPEWEKERERGGKRERKGESMLCVPHFKANPNRSSGICCIVWAPLRRCLCVLFAYPITWQQCGAGTGKEEERDVGGGGAAVASQMLILIKINALGHVEVEKLARLTFFVAFSICLAFAWPLSAAYCAPPPSLSSLHPC